MFLNNFGIRNILEVYPFIKSFILCCLSIQEKLTQLKFSTNYFILQTTVVNNLQKRIRILKDQLQRKELHVDLLKKKLQLQEENHRSRCLLQVSTK